MKASELRIWNWVNAIGFSVQDGYPPGYKKLHQIKEGKEIDFSVFFEPIPLTEDWLLKFGFELINNEYWQSRNLELKLHWTVNKNKMIPEFC